MTRQSLERGMEALMQEPTEEAIQQRWHSSKETMMWQAHQASRHSHSYREFPVGSMVLAFKPNSGPTERWGYFKGANIKTSKDNPKICAEMTAVMAALQAGYERIVGIVVVGPQQADHGSGIVSPTLHPCEACRTSFQNMPSIRPDTNLLLATPEDQDGFTVEEMNVEELLKTHTSQE